MTDNIQNNAMPNNKMQDNIRQISSKVWSKADIAALYAMPFMDLLHQAQQVHRQNFNPNQVQLCTLLNIKTGACPEDCGYCSQSRHHNTDLKKEPLFKLEQVLEAAKLAKKNGATRFCMGAAWRRPPKSAIPKLVEIIREVNNLGLETCVTLGSLDQQQADEFKQAGLDYYNHNLDTSPEYYDKIITTRPYQERLDTLEAVRNAQIKVCCGGIIGMGESVEDRIGLLHQLCNLPKHPESVPINRLIPIPGTKLADAPPIENFDFIRTIAVTRILMPKSFVRLSAGRHTMSDEMQALCFLAGANSIHCGSKLLTTANPELEHDQQLFKQLGMEPMPAEESSLL